MKKLFNFLFTISLLILITIITIRFYMLEVLINDFVDNKVSNYMLNEIKSNLSDLDEETKNLIIETLVNDKEFKMISTKISKNIIKDLIEDKNTNLDISNELNNLINSNVPYQYKKLAEIIVNKIDFNDVYIKILFNVKSKFNSTIIKVINIYSILTSDSVIALLGSIILLSLIIIILKNKSVNDILNDLGMSLFIDGGIMIILLFFLKRMEVALSMISTSKIDISLFIYFTFSFLIIGFILKEIKIKKRN